MGTVDAELDGCGIPMVIVREAKKDPLIGPRVLIGSTRRQPLVCDGKIVGFVTPHETPTGWRLGPIFVMPGFRSLGLVAAYYDSHPARTFVAFVPRDNVASMRAHKRAGFEHWKYAKAGVWMRRFPRESRD